MNATKQRWWRLLAVLLAFTLVAAACGDDDEEDTSAGDDAAAEDDMSEEDDDMAEEDDSDDMSEEDDDMAEEEHSAELISDECPVADPAESTSIDLMGWEFPITAQFASEFEECNGGNLEVNAQLLDSESAQDQIALDLGTGSPEFEVVHTTGQTVALHADNLLDLTPYIEQYGDQFGLDDIGQGFWDVGTVDGRILGIPFTNNTLHFFYNAEILADAGVTPPGDFAELVEACGVLKEAGFDDAFNMNISAGWSNSLEFISVIRSLGGDLLNDDDTPAFNSPEGLAAVEAISGVADACMSDAGRVFSIDDSEAALRAGELPMATIWASRAAAMDDPENSLVVGQIEFTGSLRAEAGAPRNGLAYVDFYSIPAGTSVDPEVIFQVIMAATDVESMDAAAAFASVSRASATNPDAPRNAAALNVSVAEGIGAVPTSDAWPLADAALGAALLEVMQNGADPAEALAAAEAEYIAAAEEAGFI